MISRFALKDKGNAIMSKEVKAQYCARIEKQLKIETLFSDCCMVS